MANEKRLIDADAEIKKLKDGYCLNCADYYEILCKTCDIREAIRIMDDAPTVDAVEVVHGRWEYRMVDPEYRYYKHECSICGFDGEDFYRYCPICGASMRDGDGNG